MEWALALAAMLAVVAVVFVARPFLRDPSPASDRLDELAPEARQRLALAEERDRALAALKELEFDHRTGKVSDQDYRAQVGPLRGKPPRCYGLWNVGKEHGMNASPIRESACPRCGEELAPGARFCSSCGSPVGELPPFETVPGPVVHENVERRWLGLPARFAILCLGFAAFGASIGLFATGSWAWGIVLLLLAAIFLTALVAVTRQSGGLWLEQSSRLAADGRSQAATTAEVWRTQLDTTLVRWRSRSRLDALETDRRPALQALGEAVWRGDSSAEHEARQRLVELEQERERVEDELAVQLAGAEERIRQARLPVQDTVMVTPNEPSTPYPPPNEGDPPEPARVPEPYPPPDEGTPPTPAPDPGQTDSE